MTLADEQRDTLRLALGYIGSSDRPDRMIHVARIRALLDDEPTPASALPELIGVQEAWEAAGGNPGIKASREQLVAALKMLDGSNEDADLLGDLVRDAMAHLYAGQVGLARACLARATEVTFTGAAKASTGAQPSDVPQASRNGCPALTSSERLAIERAIAALKTDPVAVSVLETLLRAAPVVPSDEARSPRLPATVGAVSNEARADASHGSAAQPHAPVLTDEMRLAIENAILALDEGVAPGSEHANDLRFVLTVLDSRAAVAQAVLDGAGREFLGAMVRNAWVKWARQQPSTKSTWLVPYEQLAEADKEADRQIGEAVTAWVLRSVAQPEPGARVEELEALVKTLRAELKNTAHVANSNERKRRHYNPIYNDDPVQRACGELPEGWEIRISLEKDAGTIDVYDSDGNNIDFQSDADHFDWRIHEAIDTALECAAGEASK
ncbi:hypothetical protein [Burkholderia gladioli]|uniref:hypothetical protein n=1 Tax=Burkholderia gladioli TaxID=28095 RepID=UPI00163EEA75|nr:hypothetical protein [Burkholderia gladioli]